MGGRDEGSGGGRGGEAGGIGGGAGEGSCHRSRGRAAGSNSGRESAREGLEGEGGLEKRLGRLELVEAVIDAELRLGIADAVLGLAQLTFVESDKGTLKVFAKLHECRIARVVLADELPDVRAEIVRRRLRKSGLPRVDSSLLLEDSADGKLGLACILAFLLLGGFGGKISFLTLMSWVTVR